MQRITVLIFWDINNSAPSFSLDLAETHLPCETPNTECLAKIFNDRIHLTKFTKGSTLDVLLGSEYVSDYLRFFLLLWIEAAILNLSRIFLISWVFYLSIQREIFPLSAIKLCSKPVRTSPWGPEWFLQRCFGFFIVN